MKNDLSQADQYLLQQMRQKDPDGWSQLVKRYQGRLVAFARQQLGSAADAEDAVQETFLSFLKGIDRYRGDASIETFLFGILRRRIVDQIRGRGRADRVNTCSLQDTLPSRDSDSGGRRDIEPAVDFTASWYVRREENQLLAEQALWEGLFAVIDRLQESLNFRDLKICDMVFHAQLRNKDIAAQMGMDEKQIALLKFRYIKRIAEKIQSGQFSVADGGELSREDDALLTRVWEAKRPSCPKRTTIGKFVLGTLDSPWHDYVDFHINSLGCRFCKANFDDLVSETSAPDTSSACQRIIQSTIGFLKP